MHNSWPVELASVLRVDTAFWERSPDSDQELQKLAEGARERFKLAPGLRELVETFIRDHSARRIALRTRLANRWRTIAAGCGPLSDAIFARCQCVSPGRGQAAPPCSPGV
jgi:hypothetical protein